MNQSVAGNCPQCTVCRTVPVAVDSVVLCLSAGVLDRNAANAVHDREGAGHRVRPQQHRVFDLGALVDGDRTAAAARCRDPAQDRGRPRVPAFLLGLAEHRPGATPLTALVARVETSIPADEGDTMVTDKATIDALRGLPAALRHARGPRSIVDGGLRKSGKDTTG